MSEQGKAVLSIYHQQQDTEEISWKIDQNLKIIELSMLNVLSVEITFCHVFVMFGDDKEQDLNLKVKVLNLMDKEGDWKLMEKSKEMKKIVKMQTHMNYGLLLLVEKFNQKFSIYYINEELLEFVELCEIKVKNVKDFAISKFKVNGLFGILLNQSNELFKFTMVDQFVQNYEKLSIDSSTEITILNSGAYHFTILDQDGTVFCFGNNSYLQCGILNENNTDDKIDFPIFIEEKPLPLDILRGDVQIRKTCCGASHTLLLNQDDSLYVMGSNTENQCGTNNSEKFLPGPFLLEGQIDESDFVEEGIVDCCCGPNYSVILLKRKNSNTNERMCLVSGKRLGFEKLREFSILKQSTNANRVYCSSMGPFIVLVVD